MRARPDFLLSIPDINEPIGVTGSGEMIYMPDEWRAFHEAVFQRLGGAFDHPRAGHIANGVNLSQWSEMKERVGALEVALNRPDQSAEVGELQAAIDDLWAAVERASNADALLELADRLDELEKRRTTSPEDVARELEGMSERVASLMGNLERELGRIATDAEKAREQQNELVQSVIRDSLGRQATNDPTNVLASAGLRVDPETGGIIVDALTLDGDLSGSGLPIAVSAGGTGANSAAGARSNLDVPPNSRSINAGTGLTGGGNLGADLTLSIANTAVTAGSYGSASQVATFTVNDQGQLTAAGNITISISQSNISDMGTNSNVTFRRVTTGDNTNRTDQILIDAAGYGPFIGADGTGMVFGHNVASRSVRFEPNNINRLELLGTGEVVLGGALRFSGSTSSITTETLTDYIEAEDSGGNTIKLAIVS